MPSITAYSGIVRLGAKDLEKLKAERQRVDIQMAGILIVARDVTPTLAEQTIGQVHVHGAIRASKQVKSILARKRTA